MTRLALKVLIIGDNFTKPDFDLIQKAHRSIGEITIRTLASFSDDQKDILKYIKESNSTVYVTSDVDKILIDSIKKSGCPVGVLMGQETRWYNITEYGHFHSITDLLSVRNDQRMVCSKN
jgi:hypothetical protein